MNLRTSTIQRLFTPKKGIFANDASVATLTKRFENYGITSSTENRNEFRRIFYTTPGISEYISGVILNEEGISLAPLISSAGIEIGVKVDKGLDPFGLSGEFTTKGIESLEPRLATHKNMGTSFVKWRAAFTISDSTPSDAAIQENIRLLVEYARISLAEQLVPIIEPEILMEGEHSMDDCDRNTRKVLTALFTKLQEEEIDVEKIILKTNMIMPGSSHNPSFPEEIGKATVNLLQEVIPRNIGGVVFLSGGQNEQQAIENLGAIRAISEKLEFPITFSYERVFEKPVLETWRGKKENTEIAQTAFLKFANKICSAL